jgi:hypothetical protein
VRGERGKERQKHTVTVTVTVTVTDELDEISQIDATTKNQTNNTGQYNIKI